MLKDIQPSGKKDTRSGFGDGIVEVARKNPNIIALTADLAGSLKLQRDWLLVAKFPIPLHLQIFLLAVCTTRSAKALLIVIKM
jgi:hypothetical protein